MKDRQQIEPFNKSQEPLTLGYVSEPKPLLNQSLGSFSDASGSPKESTNHSLLGAVKRELRHQLGASEVIKGIARYFNPLEPTIGEILYNERKVQKELYGN